MSPDVLLRADDLSVRFGGVLAVNRVGFEVRRGEVFTLIGPNGAGKTTVFNLISRIYTPTSGTLDFEGRSLLAQPPHAIAALGIARTFQNIELFEHATVLQNLLIGHHIHRGAGFWSNLGRALATGPKLLLLDEPSSGLNVEETEDMAWWIQDIRSELGITVLMVEHDMSLVSRVSDRVLAMNQGEVLALGTPAEVQAHPGVIEAYLGAVDDISGLRRPREQERIAA
jgi:branched-chain amino acid transport system ATP-binding protein